MRSRGRAFRFAAVLCAAAFLAGCYPSNVLEESDRAVLVHEDAIAWSPIAPESLPGAWAAERIEGDLAASLADVRYIFYGDGSYTGAGLVIGDRNPVYQTLDGSWHLAEGRLILDGAEPGVGIEGCGDRIRLSSEAGTIVFRRFELR